MNAKLQQIIKEKNEEAVQAVAKPQAPTRLNRRKWGRHVVGAATGCLQQMECR